MKTWSTYNPDYIQERFQDYMNNVTLIKMWQEPLQDSHEVFGIFTKVSASKIEIQIDEKYLKDSNRISLQKALLFHYDKDDMHFKKDLFIRDSNIIRFDYPNEVLFRDRRITERYYYKYQDFKSITYSVGEFGERDSDILTDISNAGASFVIPSSKREDIRVGDDIFIFGLTDQELPEKHAARVVYIKPYRISRESDSSLLQVGLQFTADLDSITYNSIGNVIKKKQEKVKGLDTDGFNGLHNDEYRHKIAMIRAQNPQLAANIHERVEDLDRLRYLTTEMKRDFLLDVNHDVLASALRLSSKELIFDLLDEVTDSMREEFLEKLNIAKPASAVNKAQDQICSIIHKKERSGELVLDPRSFIKYV